MKRFWRTIEWLLALAWPIVAYNVVFGRYGWSSQYYNRWSECWFALVFLVPMVGPLLFKLFSAMAGRDDAMKRAAFVAILVLGVALAVAFRPTFGGATFMGFFVPMALHGVAIYLWLNWPTKKPAPPVKQAVKTPQGQGSTSIGQAL